MRYLAVAVAALGGLILYVSLAGAGSPAPDASRHLLMVPDSAGSEAALTRSDARVVARYEEFTLVEARGEDDAALRAAGASRRDDLREVGLPGTAGLDPLAERESLAAKGVAEPAEALVLVQFVGPIKDAWLERLRSTGARIVEYATQDGYLLHARGAEVDRLAALVGTYPAVRAVTRVRAGDKVSDELGAGRSGSRMAAVQTVAGAEGTQARRAAETAGASVRPGSTVGELRTQYLRLDPSEIDALAADPAVVTVTPFSTPRLADERASQIVAGNVTSTHQPLSSPDYLSWHDGRGFGPGTFDFAIDFTDEGLDNGSAADPDHSDFYVNGNAGQASRIAYMNNHSSTASMEDCGGHGTNVASIAAGYGTTGAGRVETTPNPPFRYGMGVAPRAQIGASKMFSCGQFALDDTFTDIASEAVADDAAISNNSWGNGDAGAYSTDSREFDALVRDARPGPGVPGNQQLVEVFAAGNTGDREIGAANEGYASINSPGTAKNVITVGASENVRTGVGFDGCGVGDAAANSARDILDASSRGPTDDLRQKPDIVAPGTHVVGASPQYAAYAAADHGQETCLKAFPASNSLYSLISGTSQAAAAVSGAAALIRDDYQAGHSGVPPSPAMTKALLINSATDLAGGENGKGATIAPAPNPDQGWGRVNAGAATGTTPRQYSDQDPARRLTVTGASSRFSYGVVNPASRVKITLAWTDAPGIVGPNAALANDLDLVVSAGGRRYLGNVLSGGTSRVGGTRDSRNNVESVVLPAGTGGRFSVSVTAANLTSDGVPNVGGSPDQDFALVVSNVAAQAASPHLTGDRTTLSDAAPGGDADGALEPGESVKVGERLRNGGNAPATGITGKLAGAGGLTVQQGSSAFPNALPEASSSNQTPYAASLGASAVCGADVSATLNITSSGGAQAVPLSLGTGAAGPVTSTSSAAVPRSIPDDNGNGVESTLNVPASGRIKDVDVVIGGITHPWVGDLALELRHPDGTIVELARHPGGPDNSGNNFTGTVFDDEATTNISQASAPYTGRFRPQNDQLSRLDGKDKRGTWRLRVKDLYEGQAGTLVSWGTGVRAAVCDWVSPAGPGSGTGGGPGAAPVPVPVAPRAPSFAVAPAEQRLADALGGRLTVLGACAAACRATAKLSVSGKVARSLGLTKRRTSRPVSLGTGSARRRSAGRLSYRVKLTRRARSALRGEDRVTAGLRVAVSVTGEQDVKLKQSVGLRSTAGLGSVARKGLRLRAACSRTCPLAVGLWLDARTARKLGLKVKKGTKQVRVASRRATVSSRGRALSLKMARATRAAAARQKRLSATLKAVAGPSAGPTRAASQTLVLRR